MQQLLGEWVVQNLDRLIWRHSFLLGHSKLTRSCAVHLAYLILAVNIRAHKSWDAAPVRRLSSYAPPAPAGREPRGDLW